MLAAPLTFESRATPPLRPLNLRTDVSQVLALLDTVFAPHRDEEGRRLLKKMSLAQYPWLILRLRQMVDGIVPGFVWEEEGSIVGNVSLLTTRTAGRYLVANVAVHPHYRRRGIARALMEAVITLVRRRGGRELLLQVRENNEGAIRLYDSLDFVGLGSVTSWYAHYGSLRALPAPVARRGPDRFEHFSLRPLRRSEWRAAWRLDRASTHPDLHWPEPLPRDAYRAGVLRGFLDLLNARRAEHWVAAGDAASVEKRELLAIGTILSEWGRYHTLNLRVHPAWRGQVEPALLAKLVRRLTYLPGRNIRMDHPAGDPTTDALLRRANFRARRTLLVMKLEL